MSMASTTTSAPACSAPPGGRPRRALLRAALAGLCTAAGLAGCRRPPPRYTALPAGATVLALGDSITHGTGAPPGAAYPALLAAATGWNVINAGVPGDTSAQGLQRLATLLDEHRPALVLLSLGGNDFLRRQDEAQTRANLVGAIDRARASDAQVVLIAVPRPTLAGAWLGVLEDHPLYASVAEQTGVPLHARGWARVLADEALKADPIHPNAAGYSGFVDGLLRDLRQWGLAG